MYQAPIVNGWPTFDSDNPKMVVTNLDRPNGFYDSNLWVCFGEKVISHLLLQAKNLKQMQCKMDGWPKESDEKVDLLKGTVISSSKCL